MLHTVFVIIFVQYKHYHGVRLVVKSWEEFTVIELTHNNNNDSEFMEEFTHAYHFKRLFERTLNIQTFSKTISYDHSILEM